MSLGRAPEDPGGTEKIGVREGPCWWGGLRCEAQGWGARLGHLDYENGRFQVGRENGAAPKLLIWR